MFKQHRNDSLLLDAKLANTGLLKVLIVSFKKSFQARALIELALLKVTFFVSRLQYSLTVHSELPCLALR